MQSAVWEKRGTGPPKALKIKSKEIQIAISRLSKKAAGKEDKTLTACGKEKPTNSTGVLAMGRSLSSFPQAVSEL